MYINQHVCTVLIYILLVSFAGIPFALITEERLYIWHNYNQPINLRLHFKISALSYKIYLTKYWDMFYLTLVATFFAISSNEANFSSVVLKT